MSARRLLVAFAAAALLLLGIVPAALADEPDVTGTVTMPDGSPAVGAQVSLWVPDSDVAWSATTDAQGAWSVATGIQAGQHLSARVVIVDYASPDASGCVSSTSMTASADVTVEALPVTIDLVLADGPEGQVCSATATPGTTAHGGPTPPATDTTGPASTGGGTSTVFLVGGLAAVAVLVLGPARRPRRR